MDEEGKIYVLEVNPLPGLTPGYSDLVLIAQAVGMEYDQLIAEIMVGGLRRMRDKRREERELEREREESIRASAKAAEVAALATRASEKEKAEKKRLRLAAAAASATATPADGTVRASVRRERSEPSIVAAPPVATVASAKDDATVVPATVGSTSTH